MIDGTWPYKTKWHEGDTFDAKGSFDTVRFGPTDNGFIIGRFSIDDDNNKDSIGEKIVCKGKVPGFALGIPFRIIGKVVLDPKWGLQVKVEQAAIIEPTTRSQIIGFLGSDEIKGCGSTLAKRIVDHFGDNTMDILRNDPKRLIEVNGIGKKNLESILESLEKTMLDMHTVGFFAQFGISVTTIRAIVREYKIEAVQRVKDNPYILTKVEGFAFSRADSIAMKLGVSRTDPNRIRAGLLATLRWICDARGHTIVPKNMLFDEAREKLGVNDDVLYEKALKELSKRRSIVVNKTGCQLRKYNRAENRIKKCLKLAIDEDHIENGDVIASIMDECCNASGIYLSNEQEAAVLNTFARKISIMTGGAGTGKTATCRIIVDIAKRLGLKICLVSPTGRAAKHLSEVCDAPGYTIHRALALNYREHDDDFYDEDEMNKSGYSENTIKAGNDFKQANLVIADEASMIDTEMASYLFWGCIGKHLLLVGDPGQLPSVGAGRVLGDLISSHYSHVHGMTTKLTKTFRQEEGSPVIEAANRVLNGKSPVGVPGVLFFECASNEDVPDKIGNKVIPILEQDGLWYQDYCFLSPIKRTPYAGVNAMNAFLRPRLNPSYKKPDDEKKEFLLQEGDFVMQTKNNVNKDVFNGDIGIVSKIEPGNNGKLFVVFSGNDKPVEYTKDEANGPTAQLIQAYCRTVHKSQGDEYHTAVVILTSSQFPMLSRNMLYTAITRAREELILVGDKKAFAIAARNDKENERMTGLKNID